MADDLDVVTINSAPGAISRNAQELSAALKATEARGGQLIVYPNDSAFLVAVNNSLRFSVVRQPDGRYRIYETNYLAYAPLAIAAILGIVLLSRR